MSWASAWGTANVVKELFQLCYWSLKKYLVPTSRDALSWWKGSTCHLSLLTSMRRNLRHCLIVAMVISLEWIKNRRAYWSVTYSFLAGESVSLSPDVCWHLASGTNGVSDGSNLCGQSLCLWQVLPHSLQQGKQEELDKWPVQLAVNPRSAGLEGGAALLLLLCSLWSSFSCSFCSSAVLE